MNELDENYHKLAIKTHNSNNRLCVTVGCVCMCVYERERGCFLLLVINNELIQFTDITLSAYNTQFTGAGGRENDIVKKGQDCSGTRIA